MNQEQRFAATILRKLIDGQDIEKYVNILNEPWKTIANRVSACPPDPWKRGETFKKAISDLPDHDQIYNTTIDVNPLADLAALEASCLGFHGLLSADDILKLDWPEPKWAIPHLLPIGLSILAGDPKIGKSWFALQIALAIACGGLILGEEVEKGPIFYLALEDPPRRLKNRMVTQKWPMGLGADFLTIGDFQNTVGDLRNGGADKLTKIIKHRQYRYVVIDTLSRSIQGDQNDVRDMTEWLTPLQEMAHETNCALLLVDHHRKSGGQFQDPLKDILGSTAKGAMADTILGLYREARKTGACLSIIGREVEERKLALEFDIKTGCWKSTGEADGFEMTKRRQDIVDLLQEHGRLTVGQIAEKLDQDKGNTHTRLQNLVSNRRINRSEDGNNVFYEPLPNGPDNAKSPTIVTTITTPPASSCK